MTFPLAAIAPAITDMAGKVFDRMFPDPEQANAAKLEFMRQTQALDLQEQQEFRNFMLEYEGAAKDVHPFLQNLRGSVRPVLTYALVITAIYGFVTGEIVGENADKLHALNLLSLMFWFGERTLNNLGINANTLSLRRSRTAANNQATTLAGSHGMVTGGNDDL